MDMRLPPRQNEKKRDFAALREAETWIFDLDNTLYPPSVGLFDQIDRRMCAFIAEFLNIAHAEAYRVQKSYFREHGTTLRGLMIHHDLDPESYLSYVHDIDLGGVIPDPALAGAIARLPGRKVIYTNATRHHAVRIVERLGMDGHFEAVFDIADADFTPKPDPVAYDALIERHEIDPTSCVMVEDIARNLAPAAALGMTTVWVKNDRPWASADADEIAPDFAVDDLAAWLEEVIGA